MPGVGRLAALASAGSGGAGLEERLVQEAGLERRQGRVAPLAHGRDVAADAAAGLRTSQTSEGTGDLGRANSGDSPGTMWILMCRQGRRPPATPVEPPGERLRGHRDGYPHSGHVQPRAPVHAGGRRFEDGGPPGRDKGQEA